MVGNIIPYIGGEEEKSEKEPLRIWGEIKDGVNRTGREPCYYLPVHPCSGINGHTAAVFVKFSKKPTKEQLIEKLVNFNGSFPRSLDFPAHRSSLSSIWKRTTTSR